MEPLDGWTGGVPGAQMCVLVYGRRVSVVDVRVLCACARGERLLGVINIIIVVSYSLAVWPLESLIPLKEEDKPSNIHGGICWF